MLTLLSLLWVSGGAFAEHLHFYGGTNYTHTVTGGVSQWMLNSNGAHIARGTLRRGERELVLAIPAIKEGSVISGSLHLRGGSERVYPCTIYHPRLLLDELQGSAQHLCLYTVDGAEEWGDFFSEAGVDLRAFDSRRVQGRQVVLCPPGDLVEDAEVREIARAGHWVVVPVVEGDLELPVRVSSEFRVGPLETIFASEISGLQLMGKGAVSAEMSIRDGELVLSSFSRSSRDDTPQTEQPLGVIQREGAGYIIYTTWPFWQGLATDPNAALWLRDMVNASQRGIAK
jgi:hypothetical protein